MELNLDHLEDQRMRLVRQIHDAEESRDNAGRAAVAQFDDHRERVNAELAQLRQQHLIVTDEIASVLVGEDEETQIAAVAACEGRQNTAARRNTAGLALRSRNDIAKLIVGEAEGLVHAADGRNSFGFDQAGGEHGPLVVAVGGRDERTAVGVLIQEERDGALVRADDVAGGFGDDLEHAVDGIRGIDGQGCGGELAAIR